MKGMTCFCWGSITTHVANWFIVYQTELGFLAETATILDTEYWFADTNGLGANYTNMNCTKFRNRKYSNYYEIRNEDFI